MKKCIAIIISIVLLAGTFCVNAYASTADNAVISAWAQSDVAAADDIGIIPGNLPTDYTQPITRSQFCKLAVALYETVTGSAITGRSSFTDTNEPDVQKMAYLGVVTGYGDGTFGADDTLTREQAAVILMRLMEAMGVELAEVSTPFTDAFSDWAASGIAKVYGAGIMVGITETAFSAYANYTIEQSIVTMLREYNYVSKAADSSSNISQVKIIANGSCGTNVKWALDSDGTLTISGSGAMSFYSQTNRPWYSKRSEIKSIVIEEGVTAMFYGAFMDCYNAESVSLPSGITKIDGYLFNGCSSLTAINIPKSVSDIDYFYAFGGCTSLESITVESGNEYFCSIDGVLFRKDMSELLCYPDGKTQTSYEIPSGVKLVTAFSGNDYITELTIPSSVTSFYYNAVQNCDNLTDIYVSTLQSFLSAVKLTDLTNSPWENYTIHTTGSNSTTNNIVPSEETPNTNAAEGLLANGKEITDDNIREIIYGLKDEYPEGLKWNNSNSYYSSAMRITGLGCAGFAFICSDAAFGDLPVSGKHSDFDAIRVGDMVRMNNDTHSVVVLEKLEDSIIVTEGNYNGAIHWGREITRKTLENGNFYVQTRYPD